MKIKVCLLDDHPIVITGLKKILEAHPQIELTGAFQRGDALLRALESMRPDVLLLDIQMPGKQGDELAKLIMERYPQTAILVLTNMDQPFHVRNMFLNGVKGYLLKSAGEHTLIEAITTVHRGSQYIDNALREQMAHEIPDGRRAQNRLQLTTRERNILELVAAEMTNAEIAKKLYISLSTVETHRNNLFFKLGVKNSAGLVRKAIQLGLIKAG